MNQEQVKSIVRHIIATFGGVLAGWGAAKGWFTADQILSVLNSETFIGLVVSGVMAFWSFVGKSNKNITAAAAALPEVKAVVTEPTVAGKILAEAIPAPNVVAAGTAAAAEAVKP